MENVEQVAAVELPSLEFKLSEKFVNFLENKAIELKKAYETAILKIDEDKKKDIAKGAIKEKLLTEACEAGLIPKDKLEYYIQQVIYWNQLPEPGIQIELGEKEKWSALHRIFGRFEEYDRNPIENKRSIIMISIISAEHRWMIVKYVKKLNTRDKSTKCKVVTRVRKERVLVCE